MKSPSGFVLALVSLVGLFATAPQNAAAQAKEYRMSSISRSVVDQPAQKTVPVQAALSQFDSALATHDIDKLQAAGVGPASARLWRRFFRENPRATVTDRCPDSNLTISGDTATWTCHERVTIISEGKPRSFLHLIHFTFARNGGTWLVADRE